MKKKQIYIIADEEKYQHGDIIFNEGNSGDWVYVILSGSVELSKTVQGHKYILEVLKPGDIFGEIENITKMKRIATARAIGDTIVGVIDRQFIDKEYNQLSQQFRSILESMATRNRNLIDRVVSFTERTEPRAQRVLSVTYQDRKAFLQAYTANVSRGGLFIKTENFLNPGKQFLLRLRLSHLSKPLEIQCEVVWARKRESSQPNLPPGMGVKFTRISKTDYQILKQFIGAA
ncbi:MAG: TIGR02266 family protein [Desulfobacteraceae bacterium]|nr:TIGR02266 family protein [Desulfobacteraceae bacterium]